MKIRMRGGSAPKVWTPRLHRPPMASVGRLRKIAMLGGAPTLKHTPWWDPSWELWAHMSCRNECEREPDLYFDLHPEALWRNPKKKFWDTTYLQWLRANRVPIFMQKHFPDVPASIRYPFSTMITEFPHGYMTNTLAYMIALALMEGVTHIGVFGCDYAAQSEYGPQRGSAEHWLGIAIGRGVHVLLPPGCDLLNKPHLLYGYESHPNGVRDKSYSFAVGVLPKIKPGERKDSKSAMLDGLVPADSPDAPPLMDLGVPPALDRRDFTKPLSAA